MITVYTLVPNYTYDYSVYLVPSLPLLIQCIPCSLLTPMIIVYILFIPYTYGYSVYLVPSLPL